MAKDKTKPNTPTGLAAEVVSATIVDLTWNAAIDPTVPGQATSGVKGYRLFRDGVRIADLGPVLGYSNTQLRPNTRYRYRIASIDNRNNASNLSDEVAVTTTVVPPVDAPDTTAPTVPAGLSTTTQGQTQINLVWSVSTDPAVPGQVHSGMAGYKVFRGAAHVGTVIVPSYQDTGLTADTTYSYRVSAVDGAGNESAQCPAVPGSTAAIPDQPDTTAPSVPAGLSATAVSDSQINLAWSAATDPTVPGDTTSGVAGYQVYRGGSLLATLGLVTSYQNTGLTADTLYSYTIASRDVAGNASAQSGAATATTQSAATTGGHWFVRPNGGTYGTENGTTWTNAFDGFSDIAWGSIQPGDTLWVAGGTYTQALKPTKNGTAANRISIRRARADASQCTGAAGWSSGFDSTIVHRPGFIEFLSTGSYTTISGATTGNVATAARGWLLSRSTSTSGSGVSAAGSASDVTVEWLEMEGAGEINISGDMRALDITPAGSPAARWRFSHLKIHDWESAFYFVNASAPIIEYCEIYDIGPQNTATFHPNGMITWGCPNGIVRYCIWRKGPNGLACGEGVFFEQAGGSQNWQIYGNIFKDLDYTGVKAIEITSNVGAIKIFNNTFINIQQGTIYTSDSPSAPGGEQRNNFVYQCGVDSVTGMTNSHNVTAGSTAAFANFAGGNYRPVATVGAGFARNAGTALTSDGFINKDPDGNTRGADGTWDVGAYEFV